MQLWQEVWASTMLLLAQVPGPWPGLTPTDIAGATPRLTVASEFDEPRFPARLRLPEPNMEDF